MPGEFCHYSSLHHVMEPVPCIVCIVMRIKFMIDVQWIRLLPMWVDSDQGWSVCRDQMAEANYQHLVGLVGDRYN